MGKGERGEVGKGERGEVGKGRGERGERSIRNSASAWSNSSSNSASWAYACAEAATVACVSTDILPSARCWFYSCVLASAQLVRKSQTK